MDRSPQFNLPAPKFIVLYHPVQFGVQIRLEKMIGELAQRMLFLLMAIQEVNPDVPVTRCDVPIFDVTSFHSLTKLIMVKIEQFAPP
jgi:hypothetical protein